MWVPPSRATTNLIISSRALATISAASSAFMGVIGDTIAGTHHHSQGGRLMIMDSTPQATGWPLNRGQVWRCGGRETPLASGSPQPV
jgi:hypothetical protein